jgi:hypothetical protein
MMSGTATASSHVLILQYGNGAHLAYSGILFPHVPGPAISQIALRSDAAVRHRLMSESESCYSPGHVYGQPS